MKNFWILLITCICLCFTTACLEAQPANTKAEKYKCPPCGMDCDRLHFDKPGSCPHCHMPLQKASTIKPRTKVGILLFDGVQIIDYTGPYEIFGQAGYDVYTVSKTGQMISTAFKMKVQPNYSFANVPQPDILVVPGGQVNAARKDKATLAWLKSVYPQTQNLLSVCTGAFILAEAHLLDGKTATTFHRSLAKLRKQFPKVKVVTDKRFVDNGKIITSAGLSAGMDAALAVVAKKQGVGNAQKIALHIEYIWQPEKKFARGEFADVKYLRGTHRLIRQLRKLSSRIIFKQTQGDVSQWDARWQLTTGQVDKVWETIAAHYDTHHTLSINKQTAKWRFKGSDQSDWSGQVKLEPVAGKANDYQLIVKVWQVSKGK